METRINIFSISDTLTPSMLTPLQMLSPPEPESDTAKRELQIVSTSPFRLPDDWFIEFKTRHNNTASLGRVDKYYHEPGTGRMFRSLIAFKRNLTEENQYTPTPETVKAGNENTKCFKCPNYEREFLHNNAEAAADANRGPHHQEHLTL